MDIVCKFTEHSTDPDSYSKIHANLRVPFTTYSTLVIDSLTTVCCIEVLNTDDYIVINNTAINLTDNYSSLNAQTVSTLLNELLSIASIGVVTYVDNTNRIVFASDNTFTINACSYRLSLVLGLYDKQLPFNAVPAT